MIIIGFIADLYECYMYYKAEGEHWLKEFNQGVENGRHEQV